MATRRTAIRPFTDQERQIIASQLEAAGRRLFSEQGWKKTGIDDLCRAAGIARGTFYLFHPSKDAFFLHLLKQAENAIKVEILALLSANEDGRELLARFLKTSVALIDKHPMLRFAFSDPREPAPWMRTLGTDSLKVLTEGDDDTASAVLALLRERGLGLTVSPAVFAGLLRALVLLPLSRTTIGEAVYDEVAGTLAWALSRGLS